MRTRGSSNFFRIKRRGYKLARKEKQQRRRSKKDAGVSFWMDPWSCWCYILFLLGVYTFTSACLVQPPSQRYRIAPTPSSGISSGLAFPDHNSRFGSPCDPVLPQLTASQFSASCRHTCLLQQTMNNLGRRAHYHFQYTVTTLSSPNTPGRMNLWEISANTSVCTPILKLLLSIDYGINCWRASVWGSE